MIVLALMSACERATPPTNATKPSSVALPSDLLITLERTPCLGACPSYSVSVDSNGFVNWNGREHVDAVGAFHGRMSSEAVRNLLARLEELEFSNLKERYEVTVTDTGGARVSLRRGGRLDEVALHGIGWLDDASLMVFPDEPVEEVDVDEHDLAAIADARMRASEPQVEHRREFVALGELCEAIDEAVDSSGWIGTCPRTRGFPCDW